MTLQKITRPVWAEVDLNALAHNIKEVKNATQKGTLITAVVKADGYGHGALMAARTFLENGADRLAVATLSEAIELRTDGIGVPILILGYTPDHQLSDVVDHRLAQTVFNHEQALSLHNIANERGKKAKIHIKIDTGMSRLGFLVADETIHAIEKIVNLSGVEVEGIYTHFARADEFDKRFTEEQFLKFQWVIGELEKRGIDIPIKHVSNSAAIIDLKKYNLNMVRAGIMLYGLYPSNEVDRSQVKLKPAMTLKAQISHIKQVEKDTGVSYGHMYITESATTIGTLPIGYADGYTRLLSNKIEGTIKGQRVKQIGRICMDQCMVDLTGIKDIQVGDAVTLFGDGQNNTPHIDEVAAVLNTINYEIVCMLSKRVPRVYMEEGRVISVRDYILQKS